MSHHPIKPAGPRKGSSHEHRKLIFIATCFIVVAAIVNIILFMVGLKAGFFHRWAEHEYAGRITALNPNYLIIQERNGKETTILLSPDTTIKRGWTSVESATIPLNAYVIVVGSQVSGRTVDAVVIRIFDRAQNASPPPPR